MTTVSNQIIEHLKVKTQKRQSGTQFFGIDRNEVQNILKNTRSNNKNKRKLVSEDNIHEALSSTRENNPVENLSRFFNGNTNDLCPWLGVRQYGTIIKGDFRNSFSRHFQGEKYNLRDGYISQSGIRCKNGKTVLITCKIFANGFMPIFVCEGGEVSVKCDNPTMSDCVQNFEIFRGFNET